MKTLGAIGASVAAALSAAAAVCCSSQQPVACGGCGCARRELATQTLDVTFDACQRATRQRTPPTTPERDGGAGMCFATCDEACTALKPQSAISVGGTTHDAGQTVAECR